MRPGANMKIANTTLQMASSHVATQHHEISESLTVWRNQSTVENSASSQTPTPSTIVDLTGQSSASLNDSINSTVTQDPKLLLIKQAIEFLTGKTINLLDLSQLNGGTAGSSTTTSGEGSTLASSSASAAGFGLAYDYHEIYSEAEQTTFSVQGSVQTSDGQTIAFQLDLSMSRSYVEESNVRLRLGAAAKAQDPLVINFNGSAAQLTDQKFSFDLDSDGTTETISTLAEGSGFLAFDRNGDGLINNGTELFGTQTGDGFSDLAALDDDGNGWIDAGDSNFAKLEVWTPTENGDGTLQSIQDSGIGALSLSRISTPFALKDSYNQSLGSVRSTGIALTETGKITTIQQIDVAV